MDKSLCVDCKTPIPEDKWVCTECFKMAEGRIVSSAMADLEEISAHIKKAMAKLSGVVR